MHPVFAIVRLMESSNAESVIRATTLKGGKEAAHV